MPYLCQADGVKYSEGKLPTFPAQKLVASGMCKHNHKHLRLLHTEEITAKNDTEYYGKNAKSTTVNADCRSQNDCKLTTGM